MAATNHQPEAECFTIGLWENKYTYRRIGEGVWQCSRGYQQTCNQYGDVLPGGINESNPGIFIVSVPECLVALAGGGSLDSI